MRLPHVVLVVALVAAGCVDPSSGRRGADAAALAQLFHCSWVPDGAVTFDELTRPPRCLVDCPPAAISYWYVYPCVDLRAEVWHIAEQVRAAGFDIVEPVQPRQAAFRAVKDDPSTSTGEAWIRVDASERAIDLRPLDTELAKIAEGRCGLVFSLSVARG